MTDPYGTVRAQILDLQGNAVGGQPSNNDWRLVVDNEQLKFQHYDATANSGNGAFLTRQSFGTGLTGINVVPQGTYSINGNLQVTDDLTVDGGSLFVDASTNRVGFGTLTPSQSVHIVGNAYVDGDLTVTGTASISSSSVWTKTGGTNEVYYTGANVGVGTNNPEAQLDVNGTSKFTGNMTMKGHIIPDATNTYDLGSATKTFRHVYVGPGSLYVNGKQVVTDDSGTITISTDADQNLSLKTSGSGNVQINATGTGDLEIGAGGIVQVKKTLQMLDGQKITSSGSTTVVCGNNFQAEGSLRGTTLTLDGSNTVSAAELNVLDGATAGAVVASKAVVVDANRDISNLRNLTITGDLTVSGTTTTVNSTTVSVADSLFKYASANTADAVDMGWYGKYVDSGVTKYSGMFRDATNGSFNLFTANQVEPATTVDTTGTGYAKANMVVGDIDFTSGTMRGHILPSVNDSFDIGSAEFKIRDMYVSDSSLWVGDQHKVTISGGKMKFRKRKVSVVPAAILTETAKAENGSLNAAQTLTAALNNSSGVNAIGNMKLKHWKAYMRTLSGKGSAKIRDIFRDTSDDYDEDTGADAWLESGANAYRASGNIGIGTNNAPRRLVIADQDNVYLRFARIGTDKYDWDIGAISGGSLIFNGGADAGNNANGLTEKMRITSAGNVGIGNTAPGEKLEVGGAVKIGNADNSAAGTIKFQGGDFYGAKTAGTWTSLTSAGGSSVWSEASSTASYGGSATITGTLHLNSGDGTEKIYLTTGGTNGSKIRTSTGEYVDFYAGDGGATTEGGYRWFTTQGSAYAERMRITKDGWVGIGTNSPSRLLHLKDGNGNTYIDGTRILVSRQAYYIAPTSEGSVHDLFIGDINQNNSSNYTRFDNVTVGYKGEFRVRKGKDEAQFVIDTNGNVGIGNNTPSSKLHLVGSNEILTVESTDTTKRSTILFKTNGSDWELGSRGSAGSPNNAFYIYDQSINKYGLVISSDGSVGIGNNANPQYKLDVTGGARVKSVLTMNAEVDDTIDTGIYGETHLDKNFILYRSSGYRTYYMGLLGDNTNNSNKLALAVDGGGNPDPNIMATWDASANMSLRGNLGIGNNNPSYKLDVSGDAKVSGILRVGSYFKSGEENSGTVVAGNWYRIASSTTGNKRAHATFTLRCLISGGGHSTCVLMAGISYGTADKSTLNVLSHSFHEQRTFTQARIIDKSTYDETYLEVYCNRGGSVNYSITNNNQTDGWAPVDWTAGSIPSGWVATTHSLAVNFSICSDTQDLTVTHEGNVGIGNSTPSYKLDVNGTSRFMGDGLYTAGTTSFSVVGSNTGSGGKVARIGVASNKAREAGFSLGNSSTTADCDERWLIGRKYNGGSDFSDIAFFYTTDNGGTSGAGYSEKMRITTGGNLGIGTDNPNTRLHIHEPAASTPAYLQLTNASSGAGSSDGFQIQQSSNGLVTYLINRENGHMIFYTNNTERIRIEPAGDVGIGTNNPGDKLHVNGNFLIRTGGNNDDVFKIFTSNAGGRFGFRWSGSGDNYNMLVMMRNNTSPNNYHSLGRFENDTAGSSTVFGNFTGQHRCMSKNNLDADKYGLIVYSTGKYVNTNNVIGPTMNDSLPICNLCSTENDVRVFGVISDERDDNDTRVYGYGAFKTFQQKATINEKRIYINSLGEGSMWVCNKNGNVSNGSYISSSSVPGYGMKQDSVQLVNSTVAKITCDCNFSLTPIVKQKVKVIESTITKQREAMQDVTETKTEIVFENGVYVQKSVSTTTSEFVYDIFPLYDDAGVALVDNKGNAITHKVKKMEDYTETTKQLVLDSNGNVQYEDDLDQNGQQQMVYEYDTRFLNADATIIATEAEYNTKKANGENVYIAQFIGCTYHCG